MAMYPFEWHHERLEVWQKSVDLVEDCYRITRGIPDHERFGLIAQIRRAATSVSANIAEGCGRIGTGDRLRFLSIARASLCEARTLLVVAQRLGFVDETTLVSTSDLMGQVARLLSGLRRSIAARAG